MTATAVGGAAAVVAMVVLVAPWWGARAILVRDLVAVPRPAVTMQAVVAGGVVPRDVPGELVAAWIGRLVGGPAVVLAALLVGAAVLGTGIARLLAPRHRAGALVAGWAAVWNPWVWARLAQGQWLVVVAACLLPWTLVAVLEDRRWRGAALVMAGGATGFPVWLVVVPGAVVAAAWARRWAAGATVLAAAAVVSLPWLVVMPTVAADPDGFVAFRPAADLAAGVVASIAGGGGFHNAAVASPWRGDWLVTAIVLAATAAAVVGAVAWAHTPGDATPPAATTTQRRAVLAAGVLALLVVMATAVPLVTSLLAAAADQVPALAVVRDSQRLLWPWVVLVALGVGHVVDRGSEAVPGAAVVGLALVVVCLPDPVVGPRLPPATRLPASWTAAARAVTPADGVLAVVPPDGTQPWPFTDGRPATVPLVRMVATPVVLDRALVVEDAATITVDEAHGDPATVRLARTPPSSWTRADWADRGVGWIALVQPDLVTVDEAALPPGLDLVVDEAEIQLVRVEGAAQPDDVPPWVWVVDAAVLAAAAGVVALAVRERPTRRRGVGASQVGR